MVHAHRLDVAEQRPERRLDVVVRVAETRGRVLAVRVTGRGVLEVAVGELDRHRVVVLRGRGRVVHVVAADGRGPVGLHDPLGVGLQDLGGHARAHRERGPGLAVGQRRDPAVDVRAVGLTGRAVEPADPATTGRAHRAGVGVDDVGAGARVGADLAVAVAVAVLPVAGVTSDELTDGESELARVEQLVDPVAVGSRVVGVAGVADVVEVEVRRDHVVKVHRAGLDVADVADGLGNHLRVGVAGPVPDVLAEIQQHGLATGPDDELGVALLDVEEPDVEFALGPRAGRLARRAERRGLSRWRRGHTCQQ